jgi:hypothetical protein
MAVMSKWFPLMAPQAFQSTGWFSAESQQKVPEQELLSPKAGLNLKITV